MMKVAYFIGSLNRGGAEMLLLDICREKDVAPFEMVLIYRNDGDLTDEFKATGVPMFRIKPKGFKIGYFFQLRKLLLKEKVDVLHAQTLTNGVIGIFATSFSSVCKVVSFHGFYGGRKMDVCRNIVMRNANSMIFVSQYLYEWYLGRSAFCPEQRCNVVYNGINFDKLDLEYAMPDFIKDKKGNERVQLVMVGNFSGGRSQIVICKSIRLLVEQGVCNFDFYFVGKRVDAEFQLYDECVAYCKQHNLMDCVHFLGSRGDVPAILQYVDGFVYSTNHDSFGIALVEALASGLPVLVNDWKVMQEIIQVKEWATFFRSKDENDCCEKMKQLIGNITYRKQLAQSKKEEVRKTYSIEKHIENLTKIYERVCCNVKGGFYKFNEIKYK